MAYRFVPNKEEDDEEKKRREAEAKLASSSPSLQQPAMSASTQSTTTTSSPTGYRFVTTEQKEAEEFNRLANYNIENAQIDLQRRRDAKDKAEAMARAVSSKRTTNGSRNERSHRYGQAVQSTSATARKGKTVVEQAKKDYEAFSDVRRMQADIDKLEQEMLRAKSVQDQIKQYKRDQELVEWNLDEKQKEYETASAEHQRLVNMVYDQATRNRLLKKAYETGGQEARLAQLKEFEEAEAKLAEYPADYLQNLKSDIERAKGLQWERKWETQLEKIEKTDPQVAELLGRLGELQTWSPDSWSLALDHPSWATGDWIRDFGKAYDAVEPLLIKMGYKEEDVKELIEARKRQINKKNFQETVDSSREYAQEHPVAASAASVGANILAGVGTVDLLTQKIFYPDRPIDYYGAWQAPSAMTETIRQTVGENLEEKHGKAASFLYQTGMSMADSGVNIALAAIGVPEGVGLTILGGSAATSSTRAAHERGLSDGQALTLGIVSGIAEYATEKIGLDTFMNTVFKAGPGSSAAKTLLVNTLAEGGEEIASDVVNLFADILVSRDQSEWSQMIQRYKDMGYTDSQAFGLAFGEQAGQTALSFLGGAISGGLMGAGGSAVNALIDNNQRVLLRTGALLNDDNVQAAFDKVELVIQEIGDAETLSEDQHAAYNQAIKGLREAVSKADPEARKAAEAKARESINKDKTWYKLFQKMSEKVGSRVDNTQVEQTQFSENAAVQQAAAMVAEDRTKISTAVSALVNDAEAQAALGLDFGDTQTNTEKRTAIRKALYALVDEARTQQEKAPDAGEQEITADTKRSSGETAAVSAESEEDLDNDETPDISQFDLVTREEYEEMLKKADPDVTAAEVDQQYENMLEDYRQGELRKAAQERIGKLAMVDGKAMSYSQFRTLAQQNATRTGKTYQESVIRSAFDTAATDSANLVKEYETKRKADLEDTTKRINENKVFQNLGYTSRVDYDNNNFRNDSGVVINAYIDPKTKEIVFNGNRMDSGAAIMWTLGHEVTHKATKVDAQLVDNIIKVFSELANDGQLNSRLTQQMQNLDAEIERTRKAYDRFHKELARKEGREHKEFTTTEAREEFAADLMRYAFQQTKLYQDIVNRDAGVAVKMRDTLRRVLKAIAGDGRKISAVEKKLQTLADQLDRALAKVSDNVKNADVETKTADGMSEDTLAAATDQRGEKLFSLETMKQDLDGYMEDLRNADMVGEGKVMTEAELTGLYNGINRIMDFVEKHLDEIERNENYRSMTAENRPFSPYKENSDPHYKMALDFSTLCRKRLLTQAITERLQSALKRALTPVEQVKIRDMIKELQAEGKKLDVACALCYVEAARLKSPKVINEFLKNRGTAIWRFHSLKDETFKRDVYEKRRGDWKEQHGLDRRATKEQIKKAGLEKQFEKFTDAIRGQYRTWLQQNDPERFATLEKSVGDAEAVDAKAFLSAQNLARMRQDNPDLYDAFISKVRAATRSKAQETDVPYVRGDVNRIGQKLIDQMNEESGFRHQSWSDFQAMHLLDSIAAIIELSTRKAKMHTYTKVADMVRFLGNTGIMMNMSLIPAGDTGFDENGNLLFDPVEGVDYQTMLDLRRKFHATAGNVAIGINDKQILAMMASDDIDYIIPYHTSGLNADMRRRMGIKPWQDYTKSQNEKGDDWDKKAPKLREWYNEKDAVQAADGVAYMVEASKKYLRLCHERGLTPKFSQFLQKNGDSNYSLRDDAQNYWKLLIDRKMVDQYTGGIIVQQAVKPSFDVDTMLDILKNEIGSQAAKDAKEAEDYIVNKVLESGEGIVSKAERAELENRARILRDAALRVSVENAARELGVSEETEDAADGRQFSLSPNFERDFDSWVSAGKPGNWTLLVGTTPEKFAAIGIEPKKVRWNASKLRGIQKKHPYMTDDLLKQASIMIDNPVLVLDSKTQVNRVVMFGEVYVKDPAGRDVPVMAALELSPTSDGYELNEYRVASSYARERPDQIPNLEATQAFLDSSHYLFIDPDIERTQNWLDRTGLQLPFPSDQFGFIDSIALIPKNSKGQFEFGAENVSTPAWKQQLSALLDEMDKNNEENTDVKEKKTVPLDTATQERSAPDNVPAILGAEPSSADQYITEPKDIKRDYSLDINDLDNDPVMQAFLTAYNANMPAKQKQAIYATLDKQLQKAEKAYRAAQKRAKKHPANAKAAGSVAQQSNAMVGWVLARQRYGDIPQTGENYRKVAVPARTADDNKVSKTVSTVMGAEATPESRLTTIADAVVQGKLSYRPKTDAKAMIQARTKVAKGFQEARVDWAKAVAKGQVNKDLVAMGAVLLNNAGNNNNCTGEEYIGILTDYSDLLRRAGQALQAAKLLKNLTPEAQLYTAQRQVDKINEELRRKGIDPNKFKGVVIDQSLIDAYRRAKTDAERAEIMKKIAQNIADQIPSTAMDKFTAWRYLAMLGNFRTQIRNILGNTFMQPMRIMKATTAGLSEALIQRLGGGIERTQSVLHDGATFKAAFKEFNDVRALILGGGKYDDRRQFASDIEERRRIFKFKPLEAYRKATNWSMDQGDAIFCSFTYADALSRYIKANGTTWSKASEELKEKARDFAIREAAEATYRDDNAFSNLIVSLRVRNPDNAVKKAASVAIEGVLPFRKTPANILARTVEYSPVGLLYGGYNAAVKAVGKKDVTGTEIINQLAKGLTGTGLIALGMYLASIGLLVGKAPDDDKEKEAWKREGHQAYSLEIGGMSYTLDWMAPTCVPFFLGANLHQAYLENGVSLETALDSLRTISDPVLEMSMLQGIQNLIDNAANYGDDSALVRLTTDALWNYVTQVVPTMLGQGERAFENQRMTTYTDKNSKVPTEWQYKAGKASAKIPGVDYAQLVYTDAWGRSQTDVDNPTLHAVLQFFSPGYASKIETSPMEEELTRLYKATGNKKVLISSADHNISYTWEDASGEKHQEKKDLTADEYLTYNTTRGRKAYSILTEITESRDYKNMTDEEKAKCVEYAYDYATQIGKGTVARNFDADSWVENAAAAREIGLSEAEFITARAKYGTSYFTGKEYESMKDAIKAGVKLEDYIKMHANVDKKFFSSYTQSEVKDYLRTADIPEDQKAILWSQTLSNEAKDKYNTAVQGGISPVDYYHMRMYVDADGSGSVTQKEAQAYLDSTSLSRKQKSLLWSLINSGWKKNPYS